MNGLDVLSHLRRRFSTIPVILVTAFGGTDVANEALRRGACQYVEKPYRVAALVDVVQSILEGIPPTE